jgi:hypothetical protein
MIKLQEVGGNSSPSIIRIIKSRRMSWAGHVARMGRRGIHIVYWLESQKERNQLERSRYRKVIILKWILE